MRFVLVIAAVAAGCGSPVAGLGNEQPLIATVRGSLLGLKANLGTRMRVGIMWAGVPPFVPYCHEFGPTPLDPERAVPDTAEQGCRDPFTVVPRVMGPNVALDPEDQSFEIPIRQVPPASVMIGEPGARVAYGSIVLFEDASGDGDFSFPRSCGGFGGGGGFSSVGGGAGADGGVAQEVPDDARFERIYGATFDRLTAVTSTRVVYVEGRFERSYFYPAPEGCAETPPPGFSLWQTGNVLDPSARCRLRDIDAPTILPFEGPTPVVSPLQCVPGDRQTFPRQPNSRLRSALGEPDRYAFTCLQPEGTIVVVDKRCLCKEVRTYPLAGCRDEVDCPVPEWDFRANPPEGWPCVPNFGP